MNVSSFSIFIPVIAALTSGILAYMYTSNNAKNQFKSERYKNVIFPAFRLIESELFKTPNKQTLLAIQKIFEEYPELAGVSLLYWLEKSIHGEQTSYNLLCEHLCYEYDKLCQLYGISKRSFNYCIERKQYKDTEKELRRKKHEEFWVKFLMILGFTIYMALSVIEFIQMTSKI